MDKEIRFIDANIFLEVFLKDRRWEEAMEFLFKVSTDEISCLTSDFIIFSIALNIQDKLKSTEYMKKFILSIGNMKGLKIARFTPSILLFTVSLMEKYNLDFDDSLQIAYMKAFGIREIVSFDSDFDKVTEIERVEPKDIL